MKLSALIAPLIAAKADHETIMAVVVAFEAQQTDALEKRREADRNRQKDKRSRDASRDVTLRHSDRLLVTRAEDSSSKKQITEKEERKKDSAAKPRGDLDAFKGELSSILDPARVDAIVAVRRKKGATMTAHAGSLLVSALRACPDPCTAADEMVLRNWTGIKPEWLENRSRQQGPPPGNRKPNAVDAMHQIFQERGWTSEPEILRSDHSDDQRVPPERSGYSGAVVDLRSGAYRRV